MPTPNQLKATLRRKQNQRLRDQRDRKEALELGISVFELRHKKYKQILDIIDDQKDQESTAQKERDRIEQVRIAEEKRRREHGWY